ncbi:very-long-chain (3R)-3-hydroxyacyl-CoA dehydratase PASTICCINO 2A isoform X2 [Ziziphus jujuba]|uniref:Very-long-chain (3R)-3-hydroxyacyl-CoA dehydratase n=1 Tax=Ziziphus jujuba TaxID=326968 RepID=A0A6P6GFZ4_ZIZJJ|nr:very-long-chain (3R)-3-hydroxyacyl-CoA dehydratase PASTICCINO 2A isoform X2 [Ziziphus jujuba]
MPLSEPVLSSSVPRIVYIIKPSSSLSLGFLGSLFSDGSKCIISSTQTRIPCRLQLDCLHWVVSSIVLGFEDTEGNRLWTCLQVCRKASSACSKRCCFGGLVRSPITATLPQILGRLYITWGILWSFPGQTQTHILVSTLVFSWSITEVVRYSFFGTKEALGFAPSWLLWLSTFFLLHPIGVTSEIGLIYIALPDIKESEKYSIKMPNKWNFSFYFFYAAIFTIGIFSIGSFFMFQHLCRQRNKALSKPKIV